MSINKRIEKIMKMEEILDEHNLKIDKLKAALEDFLESQTQYTELEDYYLSEQYELDFDSLDKGEFPEDLKCGVFSQDAVYNLISDNFNIAVEMLEVATKIIKNH